MRVHDHILLHLYDDEMCLAINCERFSMSFCGAGGDTQDQGLLGRLLLSESIGPEF